MMDNVWIKVINLFIRSIISDHFMMSDDFLPIFFSRSYLTELDGNHQQSICPGDKGRPAWDTSGRFHISDRLQVMGKWWDTQKSWKIWLGKWCFFMFFLMNMPEPSTNNIRNVGKNAVNPPIFGLQCPIINWSDGWNGTFFSVFRYSGLPVRLICGASP